MFWNEMKWNGIESKGIEPYNKLSFPTSITAYSITKTLFNNTFLVYDVQLLCLILYTMKLHSILKMSGPFWLKPRPTALIIFSPLNNLVFLSIRLIFLVIITLFQMRQFSTANYQLAMLLDVDLNKVLYGHSFINISGITAMENCLEHCLANCFCLSFQICEDEAECQLCSSNKYLNSQTMQQSQGCTSYNFRDHGEGKVNWKVK